jgi:hypothetical protein
MIQFLDSVISIHSLIWLFPVAFMIHDFEEMIRIEPWFRKHHDYLFAKVPARFHKDLRWLSRITAPQFSVAVCLEFIIFIPCTFLAAEMENYLWFLGFNSILLLHVFMHLGQALYVKKLVPGVVTAAGVTLPYTVYLFYRLLSENVVEVSDIFTSVAFGVTLVPIVVFGHWLGEKLVPAANGASR